MSDVRNDPDVRDALESDVPSIADPTERERISNFLSVTAVARPEVRVEQLEAVVAAGREADEARSTSFTSASRD